MMTYIAAVTRKIELVPSVIMLPARPTVLVAKQAATLDNLSGGRLRLGIGVGKNPEEYAALGADFHTRGDRCEEQMELLKRLWTEEIVDFEGKYDRFSGAGINPLPVQKPIPMWVGAAGLPIDRIRRRIGRQADGSTSARPRSSPVSRRYLPGSGGRGPRSFEPWRRSWCRCCRAARSRMEKPCRRLARGLA